MPLASPAPPIAAPPPDVPAAVCRDCDTPRLGAYCHSCGQRHQDGPLRLEALARDFLLRKLSLERGVVHTFVQLSIRPGRVIHEYWNGRRRRYTNPVGYLLLSAALYAGLLPLWIGHYHAQPAAEAAGDPAVEATIADVLVWLERHPLLNAFALCLIFVPALRYLVRRSITFAESAVFGLFVFAHGSILTALATPILLMGGLSFDATQRLLLLLVASVLVIAADGAFGGRLTMILRVLAAFAISLAVLMLVLSVGIIGVYIVRTPVTS